MATVMERTATPRHGCDTCAYGFNRQYCCTHTGLMSDQPNCGGWKTETVWLMGSVVLP